MRDNMRFTKKLLAIFLSFAILISNFQIIGNVYAENTDLNLGQITKLNLDTRGVSTLVLTWKKVQGASGYDIYRLDTKSDKYVYRATTNTNTYKDKELKSATNYYYKVKPYKVVKGKKKYGDYSNKLKATTKPCTPKVNLESDLNTSFIVTWTNTSSRNSGYKVYMSKTSIDELDESNQVKVYTYLKIREDDISLFGFNTNEELHMFELLISVGGIGAKSAITILSNITPSRFALAVITNDVNSLKKLPGIGAKTAQRIILELKDKIKTEEAIDLDSNRIQQNNIKKEEDLEELIQALQVLGYRRYEINKVLPKVKSETLEDKIKETLQYLAK